MATQRIDAGEPIRLSYSMWSEAYEDAEGAKVNPAWYTIFHRDGSEPGVLIKDLDEVIRDEMTRWRRR